MAEATVKPVREIYLLEPSGVPNLAGTWLDNQNRKGNGINNLTDYLNSDDSQYIYHYGDNANRFNFRCDHHNIFPTGVEITIRASSTYTTGALLGYNLYCNGREVANGTTSLIDTDGVSNHVRVASIDKSDREYTMQNRFNNQYDYYTFEIYDSNDIPPAGVDAPDVGGDGNRLYNLSIKWLGDDMDNYTDNPLDETVTLTPKTHLFNSTVWVNESGTETIDITKIQGLIGTDADIDESYLRKVGYEPSPGSGEIASAYASRFFSTYYNLPSGGSIDLVFDSATDLDAYTEIEYARLQLRLASEPASQYIDGSTTGPGIINSDSFGRSAGSQLVSLTSTDGYNSHSEAAAWNGVSFHLASGYMFRASGTSPSAAIIDSSYSELASGDVRIISDVYIGDPSMECGLVARADSGGTNMADAFCLIASGDEIKIVERASDSNTMLAQTSTVAGELGGTTCRFLLELEGSGIHAAVSTPSGNLYTLSAWDDTDKTGSYYGVYSHGLSTPANKFQNVRMYNPTRRNDEHDAFYVQGYHNCHGKKTVIFGVGTEVSSSGFQDYTIDLAFMEDANSLGYNPDMDMHVGYNDYKNSNLLNDIHLSLVGLPSGAMISAANLILQHKKDNYVPLWIGGNGVYCPSGNRSDFGRNRNDDYYNRYEQIPYGSGLDIFDVSYYTFREIADGQDASIVYSDIGSDSGVYYLREHTGAVGDNTFTVTSTDPSGYAKQQRDYDKRGIHSDGTGHTAWRYAALQHQEMESANDAWVSSALVENFHYNPQQYYWFDLGATNWNSVKPSSTPTSTNNGEQQYSMFFLISPSGQNVKNGAGDDHGSVIMSMFDKDVDMTTHIDDSLYNLYKMNSYFTPDEYNVRLRIKDKYGSYQDIMAPIDLDVDDPVGIFVVVSGDSDDFDSNASKVFLYGCHPDNGVRKVSTAVEFDVSQNIANYNKLALGAGMEGDWHTTYFNQPQPRRNHKTDAFWWNEFGIIEGAMSHEDVTNFWSSRTNFQSSGFNDLDLPIASGNENSYKYLNWEVPDNTSGAASSTGYYFYNYKTTDRFIQLNLPTNHAWCAVDGFPSGITVKTYLSNNTNNPSGLVLRCGTNLLGNQMPEFGNNNEGDIWGEVTIPSSEGTVYEFPLTNLVGYDAGLSAPSGDLRQFYLETIYPGVDGGSTYYGDVRIYSLEIFMDGWCVPGTGNDDITLYESGSPPKPSDDLDLFLFNNYATLDLDLFTHGHIGSSDSMTLYTLAGASNNPNLPFYTYGKDVGSGNLDLYIGNSVPISGGPLPDGQPLFIEGVFSIETQLPSGLPLYIFGGREDYASGDMEMYMYATTNSGSTDSMTLYTDSQYDPANTLPLYIKVENGTDTEEIPLYIGPAPLPKNDNLSLVVYNNYEIASSSVPMFIGTSTGEGGEPTAGQNINLYIARSNENQARNMNMYISGPLRPSGELSMYIMGVTDTPNSNVSLMVSGSVPPDFSQTNFYTHGF